MFLKWFDISSITRLLSVLMTDCMKGSQERGVLKSSLMKRIPKIHLTHYIIHTEKPNKTQRHSSKLEIHLKRNEHNGSMFSQRRARQVEGNVISYKKKFDCGGPLLIAYKAQILIYLDLSCLCLHEFHHVDPRSQSIKFDPAIINTSALY